ncbi:MAG: hypothetical protein BWY52_01761 [Chloroflexi bacterium ADurb.Bin325]|nr:MAG: hypothetical protein BWY52_01761 [Chloroflexi bacterium ADurb.Bin325]
MSRCWLVIPILLVVLVGAAIAPAAAAGHKSYMAERFDVDWNLLPDGVLEVVETVEFRFEGGPFTYVYRELPTNYSDGITNIQASLDGQPLSTGKAAGEFEVSGSNPTRITWRFAATSDATHVFQLRYWMLGVVRQETDADLFLWNALPTSYEYRIAHSTIRLTYPAAARLSGPVEIRRGRAQIAEADGQVVLTAADLASDTPLTVAVRFAPGSLISVPAAWQARDRAAQAARPGVLIVTLGVLAVGVAWLYALWARGQRAISPPAAPGRVTAPPHTATLPDGLPPALAGVLMTVAGRPTANHALAALFSLAQRGVLSIEEAPKGGWYRPRDFVIRRIDPVPADLRPHETALLDLMFSTRSGRSETVKLSALGQRLGRKFSRFSDPLLAELQEVGLLDPARRAFGQRFLVIGVVLLIAVMPLLALAALLLDRFGPYGFLVPAAVFLLGMIAFVFATAYSPLSDQGAREAARWQGFVQYLKDVIKAREPAWDVRQFDRYLPYAVAAGLASGWAGIFQKQSGIEIPAWFSALAGSSDGSRGSFAAMMSAVYWTGSSGAGGAGAGGGGGSGAG